MELRCSVVVYQYIQTMTLAKVSSGWCSIQSIVHSRPLETLASVIVWMYWYTTTLQRNSTYTMVVCHLSPAIIQPQLAAVCNISHWISSSSWMRWHEIWYHHPRRFQYTETPTTRTLELFVIFCQTRTWGRMSLTQHTTGVTFLI